MEVGIGGEYDCTNVIPRPSCTGVTSLAIEHTIFLGNTLESIAWHKGGIFKPGAPALTVEQPSSALAVLRQRAHERHVPSHPSLKLTSGAIQSRPRPPCR
jgi:folylpolyglutamate synthase